MRDWLIDRDWDLNIVCGRCLHVLIGGTGESTPIFTLGALMDAVAAHARQAANSPRSCRTPDELESHRG